jgi:hypothetical protein
VLAKTVHVVLEDRKINGAVILRDTEYYFRVDQQKISEDLRPGMLAFSSDGQLVYVLEVIDDRTPEEEATYTGILTKIFSEDPVIKSGSKGIEHIDSASFEKVVYAGLIVELVDRRFKKTDKNLKFKSSEKINGKISKGDIVPIVLHTKDGRKEKHYVLVQRIIENASQKQRLMNTRRRPTNWFYKKTDKGYKKTRYVQEVIGNGEIEKKKSAKKKTEKRQSEVSKSEKVLKEADEEFNRTVRNFVIRQRKD